MLTPFLQLHSHLNHVEHTLVKIYHSRSWRKYPKKERGQFLDVNMEGTVMYAMSSSVNGIFF
jgi:hypothetical protein